MHFLQWLCHSVPQDSQRGAVQSTDAERLLPHRSAGHRTGGSPNRISEWPPVLVHSGPFCRDPHPGTCRMKCSTWRPVVPYLLNPILLPSLSLLLPRAHPGASRQQTISNMWARSYGGRTALPGRSQRSTRQGPTRTLCSPSWTTGQRGDKAAFG